MSEFTITRLDGNGGLKLAGELDVATAPRFSEVLAATSAQGDVVLDLSELTFLDSCGVRALLEAARARNGDGPIVVLDPSAAVSRVFEIIGLDQHPGVDVRRSA